MTCCGYWTRWACSPDTSGGGVPAARTTSSFEELTDVTRRRLCLPPERTAEVADALIEAGADPGQPAELASSGREVVTIWWQGGAA